MWGHLNLQAVRALTFAFMALVAMRGLVPDGYMIDRSAETGSIVLRICGGLHEHDHAPSKAQTPVDHHQMHGHGGHDQTSMTSPVPASSGDEPMGDMSGDEFAGPMCPFALTALMDAPVTPQLPGPYVFGAPLLGGEPFYEPVVILATRPPLPPRSPPFYV